MVYRGMCNTKRKSLMKNRSALVIIYTGRVSSYDEQRLVTEFFAKKTDAMSSTEDIEVYGLDASDIAKGVTIKAVQSVQQIEQLSQVDLAAIFIGEHFKDSISAGIPTFAANISAVYVNIKLRGVCSLSEKETQLVTAVELLSQDGAYEAISSKIRRKYKISLGIIGIIKNIYDGVCQGRIIGW